MYILYTGMEVTNIDICFQLSYGNEEQLGDSFDGIYFGFKRHWLLYWTASVSNDLTPNTSDIYSLYWNK